MTHTPSFFQLSSGKPPEGYRILPLTAEDSAAVLALIAEVATARPLTVLPAEEKAFSAQSLEWLENGFFQHFQPSGVQPPDRGYWVLRDLACQQIVGGVGLLPRFGEAENGFGELRHLYLQPALHGKGLARRLVTHCMAEAARMGYRQVYLETLSPPNKQADSPFRFFHTGRNIRVTSTAPYGG